MGIPLRQIVVGAAALVLLFGPPSCAGGFPEPTEVTSLRILAVSADQPYVQPGEEVTLRMTYHDGIEGGPRPIQITWIAGCLGPAGAPYYFCYSQLGKQLEQVGEGSPDGLFVHQEVAPPELSGVPNAVSFSAEIPKDVFGMLGDPESGADEKNPDAVVAYLFFTVCAGTVRPEAEDSEADFPLGCFDEQGNRVGAGGFVPGYTEVFIFADERPNVNPPVEAIGLDEFFLAETPEEAPVVARCDPVGEQEQGQEEQSDGEGCAKDGPCDYVLRAIVADVAEDDPAATELIGEPQREALWADFYVTGGTLGGGQVFISGAKTGYTPGAHTTWTAPEDPALVTIWTVVHDDRGGASVVRGYLRVE